MLAADHYRTPLPAEALTYELTGFAPENDAARFSFDEWTRNRFALLASAAEILYEQAADHATRQKRRIEHVRTLYRKDDLTALLPLGEVEQVTPADLEAADESHDDTLGEALFASYLAGAVIVEAGIARFAPSLAVSRSVFGAGSGEPTTGSAYMQCMRTTRPPRP